MTSLAHNGTAPVTLPLSALSSPADNPRRQVGDVSELAASIAAVGLLEPLVVTPREDGYVLVCGSRRYTAAVQLGLSEVPVVVRELDERGRQEAMLVENLQREDLSVLEEAHAFQALLDLGLSQRELAERIGRSQPVISKRVALLKLPVAAARALDSGGITLEDAHELLKLAGMPKRLAKAFSDGRGVGSIDYHVRQQLREHETAEKIGRETERLKKAGVKLLSPVKDEYGRHRLPKGAVQIVKDGDYDALDLDPRTHAKEPCHAAVVMDRWGEVTVFYVCTDRKRHPAAKTLKERSSARFGGQRDKEREKERREKAAAKRRREFEASLVAGKVAAADALEQVVAGFLTVSQQDVLKQACELLALEPRVTKHTYATTRDYTSPIAELAAKGAPQRQRVALALGLASREARMEMGYVSWGPREREHLDRLVAQGYELDPAERSRLPRARKAKDG